VAESKIACIVEGGELDPGAVASLDGINTHRGGVFKDSANTAYEISEWGNLKMFSWHSSFLMLLVPILSAL